MQKPPSPVMPTINYLAFHSELYYGTRNIFTNQYHLEQQVGLYFWSAQCGRCWQFWQPPSAI